MFRAVEQGGHCLGMRGFVHLHAATLRHLILTSKRRGGLLLRHSVPQAFMCLTESRLITEKKSALPNIRSCFNRILSSGGTGLNESVSERWTTPRNHHRRVRAIVVRLAFFPLTDTTESVAAGNECLCSSV